MFGRGNDELVFTGKGATIVWTGTGKENPLRKRNDKARSRHCFNICTYFMTSLPPFQPRHDFQNQRHDGFSSEFIGVANIQQISKGYLSRL